METIEVPVSEYGTSPILMDKDCVRYIFANYELRQAARHIDGVWGFLNGKAVVLIY
jgi:hypothetical protein